MDYIGKKLKRTETGRELTKSKRFSCFETKLKQNKESGNNKFCLFDVLRPSQYYQDLWRSCQAGQLTYSHCLWAGLVDLLSQVNQCLVHILSPVSWISRRGRMVIEIISWSTSTKVIWEGWDSSSRTLDLLSDTLPTTLRYQAEGTRSATRWFTRDSTVSDVNPIHCLFPFIYYTWISSTY